MNQPFRFRPLLGVATVAASFSFVLLPTTAQAQVTLIFSKTSDDGRYTIPNDSVAVFIQTWGAGGGGGLSTSGGGGAYASGLYNLRPGVDTFQFDVLVGGGGKRGLPDNSGAGSGGGFQHGGNGNLGGGGGGASRVSEAGAGFPYQDFFTYAGSGGGGGELGAGGAGGALVGETGGGEGGRGGTQTAGGATAPYSLYPGAPIGPTAGDFDQGGAGYSFNADPHAQTGGGGAGLYGGGGGLRGGGGGGGSSYYASPLYQAGSGGAISGLGATPANTGSMFYAAGVGVGGAVGQDGGDGLVVLTYYRPGDPIVLPTSAAPEANSVVLFLLGGIVTAGVLVRRRRGSTVLR